METEPELIAQFVATGKAKLVYRHLLQLGERTEIAAVASECAADQGKFWEMRKAMYANQGSLYGDVAGASQKIAQDIGLDGAALGACVQAGTHLEEVRADYAAAQQERVQSRPVFDINGTRLVGAQPLAAFAAAIEKQ